VGTLSQGSALLHPGLLSAAPNRADFHRSCRPSQATGESAQRPGERATAFTKLQTSRDLAYSAIRNYSKIAQNRLNSPFLQRLRRPMCGKSLTFRTGHPPWRGCAPPNGAQPPEYSIASGKAQPFRTSSGTAVDLPHARLESLAVGIRNSICEMQYQAGLGSFRLVGLLFLLDKNSIYM
jgi:hypothetical protein